MPNFNSIGSGVSEPQMAENRYIQLTCDITLTAVTHYLLHYKYPLLLYVTKAIKYLIALMWPRVDVRFSCPALPKSFDLISLLLLLLLVTCCFMTSLICGYRIISVVPSVDVDIPVITVSISVRDYISHTCIKLNIVKTGQWRIQMFRLDGETNSRAAARPPPLNPPLKLKVSESVRRQS